MPYLSADEFREILHTKPLSDIVNEYLFQGTPYVFKERPEHFENLAAHLVAKLGVTREDIRIVGSAQVGFSLSPDAFPRLFSDESDVDVAVVNAALFDTVWFTLLKWHYPRRLVRLGTDEWDWLCHRTMDLYWGWFVPDRIRYKGLLFPDTLKPLRDISTRWFNAFQSLGLRSEFAGRVVSGRLYRTWDHALAYHSDGLRQIKESMEE